MYKPDNLVETDLDLDDECLNKLVDMFDVKFPNEDSAIPLHMLAALPEEEYRQMKITVMLAEVIINQVRKKDG